MRTQKADPVTRARATRGFVARPLASVLLAMGAVSLAAAPTSAMVSSTRATVEASSSTPTTTPGGPAVTGDGTPALDLHRTRLSE
jgi:hypothetical protein